ncbi:MAG TPA: L-histidine N(alpha)-methyltransferase [Vicinamibacterales bacterium]|nr:L-histidine N(alpha)-methyltransferase [Vicinamibacterales bacterium]
MSTQHSAAFGRQHDTDVQAFAEDVAYYLSLTPRQLPSRYLYDALGSALFEAICHLPWYSITRAEHRLLAANAGDILGAVEPLAEIVELGPGGGEKLSTLLNAAGHRRLRVHLVDVSPTALATAARTITAGSSRPHDVVQHQGTYEAGLDELSRQGRPSGRRLCLFLGSNIGNFDPPSADEFVAAIRRSLRQGDGLVIGADLVKPAADLILAYDDPLGVTAAFNKNLLVRANRELGANFDLDAFDHRAIWNEDEHRIEMHLVSRRRQSVNLPAARLNVDFEEDEIIWTESSYKYDRQAITGLLERAGFSAEQQWIDDGFALTVARAV